MQHIAVIDYGMGNLRSVSKALEHVASGARIAVTNDPAEVARADRVVFPGQGAMPDCMRELAASGVGDALLEAAQTKPFLGICLGLQMLFDASDEGDVQGLGVLAGRVKRFPKAQMAEARLKVPHMGWNEVVQTRAHPLWAGIADQSRFYFVHSYYVEPAETGVVAGRTHYPGAFTSCVASANIFAVQFHPEKSHTAGLRLLSNFVSWNP
jgi:imidazole glycerol-phosphate synthase subunit HisH